MTQLNLLVKLSGDVCRTSPIILVHLLESRKSPSNLQSMDSSKVPALHFLFSNNTYHSDVRKKICHYIHFITTLTYRLHFYLILLIISALAVQYLFSGEIILFKIKM